MLWDRMFRHARFAADHRLQRLPERPFDDLGDYFRWMFAPDTVTRAAPGIETMNTSPPPAFTWRASFAGPLPASYRDGAAGAPTTASSFCCGTRAALSSECSQFAHFLDALPVIGCGPGHPWTNCSRRGGGPEASKRCMSRPAWTAISKGGRRARCSGPAPGQEEAAVEVALHAPTGGIGTAMGLAAPNPGRHQTLVRQWGWLPCAACAIAAVQCCPTMTNRVRSLEAMDVLAVAARGLAADGTGTSVALMPMHTGQRRQNEPTASCCSGRQRRAACKRNCGTSRAWRSLRLGDD